MRRTLVHGDVNMVHDSLLQDLFRLVQAVFCTTIVVLVLGQYVDITINEGTLQKITDQVQDLVYFMLVFGYLIFTEYSVIVKG